MRHEIWEIVQEEIKGMYEALPKLDCGFCGFGSEIIGVKVPAYSYGLQPAFAPKLGVAPSPAALRVEV